MGVGGCRCLSSSRTSRFTFASFVLSKSAPSSASTAYAAMSLRIVQVIWIVPLMNIGSVSRGMLPRKKYPPARLCAMGALR
jgi:hypothetical protein